MQANYEVSYAIRYIYPGGTIPLVRTLEADTNNPFEVLPVHGATAFDFIRIFSFEIEDGDVIEHTQAEDETYYWGIELSIDDIEGFQDFPEISELTSYERFVLTYWGGYVPLKENEVVIPYPKFYELPADMRPN